MCVCARAGEARGGEGEQPQLVKLNADALIGINNG